MLFLPCIRTQIGTPVFLCEEAQAIWRAYVIEQRGNGGLCDTPCSMEGIRDSFVVFSIDTLKVIESFDTNSESFVTPSGSFCIIIISSQIQENILALKTANNKKQYIYMQKIIFHLFICDVFYNSLQCSLSYKNYYAYRTSHYPNIYHIKTNVYV